MSTALRVLLAAVINGVTVYGVFFAGWSVATALALYWSENVLSIVLITLLFLIHRLVTHKEGRGALLAFLFSSSVFTFVHGIFLGLFIFKLFPEMPTPEVFNWPQFKLGMMMIGGVLLVRFLIDTAMVKSMSFATLRAKSESFMNRVAVAHLTIIFGMFAMIVVGRPRAMFVVFAVIKFAADIVPITDPKIPEKKRQAVEAEAADDELVQA